MGNPQSIQIECYQCKEKIWVVPPDDVFTKLVREGIHSSNDCREGRISCPFCRFDNDLFWNRR